LGTRQNIEASVVPSMLSIRLRLVIFLGAAVPCWPQLLPSTGPQSRSSTIDCAEVTTGTESRPAYQLDRSTEDWSGLCDPVIRNDALDAVKYIRFGQTASYISLGGELRSTYEFYHNYNWGAGPQTHNGYYLNRVMGHADVHFGTRLRVFAELQSGLEFGRNAGPRPSIDEDKLDFSQFFFELTSLPHDKRSSISVRIGRQELNYGEGTLVSTREVNVRRPFDGIKIILRPRDWRIDIFTVKPVSTPPGPFDDAPDHSQTFWGVWATKQNALRFVRQLDFYYLGLDRASARFDQGIGRERLHTLGFNAHEQVGAVRFFQEGDLQLGTFGSGRLLAWKFAHGLSYSPARVRYQPTFGIQGAVSSGDRDSKNADLQTFDPLFPKGLYYGYMIFTSGSLNAIVAHPSFGMQLSKILSLNLDNFFLWRQTTADGLYAQSGLFLRTGQTSPARYIGATQDLSIVWRLDRHITVRALAAYYEVGPYLRETQPPGRNARYFSVTASYKF
jgi:Alginate export